MEPNNIEALYQQAKERYLHYACEDDLVSLAKDLSTLGDYKSAKLYLEKTNTLITYYVGKGVSYGKHNDSPIHWHVADQKGKMRLLICDEVIDWMPYNAERENTSWKTCGLRKWLNSDFLKSAFTNEEKLRIIAGPVKTPANPKWFTDGSEDSMDKVFVLNYDEAIRYMPTDDERKLDRWYWLRTPGSNLLSAVGVYTDGSIYDIGFNINADGGVRPAMWILLRV